VASASASVVVGLEFRLSAGSYQDFANWFCSLLIRRTLCVEELQRTHPKLKNKPSQTKPDIVQSSLVALHDHCSYKASSVKHCIMAIAKSSVICMLSRNQSILLCLLSLRWFKLAHIYIHVSILDNGDMELIRQFLTGIRFHFKLRKPWPGAYPIS